MHLQLKRIADPKRHQLIDFEFELSIDVANQQWPVLEIQVKFGFSTVFQPCVPLSQDNEPLTALKLKLAQKIRL